MDLVFDNVTLTYDKGQRGIEGVNFDAKGGEITLLVGEEGSGKTTVLFASCCLSDITEGRITLGGKDVKGLETKEVNAVYCSSETGLKRFRFPSFDIARPLIMRGMRKKEAFAAAEKAIDELGIKDIAGKPNGKLSKEEKQIVFLASGYARKADLILFNHAEITDRFMTLAASVAKKLTVPVIIAVNNAHCVKLGTVDKAVLLYAGRIIREGKLGQLRSNPLTCYEMCILSPCSTIKRNGKTECFPLSAVSVAPDGDFEGEIEWSDGNTALVRIERDSPCVEIATDRGRGEKIKINISKTVTFF